MLVFTLQRLPKIHIVGNAICDANWRLPARQMHDYEMILLYRGEATFFIENTEYVLKSGDFLLIRPELTHYATVNSAKPCSFYFVHFEPTPLTTVKELSKESILNKHKKEMKFLKNRQTDDILIESSPQIEELYIPTKMSMGNNTDEALILLQKAFFERMHSSIHSHSLISLHVTHILLIITRMVINNLGIQTFVLGSEKMPEVLQKSISFIQFNFPYGLSVNDVCSNVGVSPQYIRRLFKQYMNKTPIQYINELRIGRAIDLLLTTSKTIKEIAYAIGLDNPNYLRAHN